MGLVCAYGYQHHDPAIMQPVLREMVHRGHNVIGPDGFDALLNASGPRVLFNCADFVGIMGHVQGVAAAQRARWNHIPTVGLQHGYHIGDEEPYKSNSDVFCTWGTAHAAAYDHDTIVVTGNPALDSYARIEMMHRDCGLLLPCFLEQVDIMNTTDPKRRAEIYAEEIKQKYAALKWFVRPHPSDYKRAAHMEAAEYLARLIGAEMQTGGQMLEFIIKQGVSVVAGTSTGVLESIILGCKDHPMYMNDYPDTSEIDNVFFDLGKSASNVADVLCAVMA